VWDGSSSQLNSIFIQPTGSTYDFLPQASGVGQLYGLGVHSFVVIGLDKKIKYVARNYNEAALQSVLDTLTTTPGEKPKAIPFTFYLEQNYPNPFNPSTTIEFEVKLSQSAHADVTVYDVTGRKVKTLFSQTVISGFYTAQWDGTDELGEQAPSGVYLYTLNLPDQKQTKRMLLVR
jgi:hypothetical protein